MITNRGKTTSLAQLPNNLIIDLEDGTDYIDGYVVKATNYLELYNIAKALKEEEHSFKFVTIDTITALESMANEYAIRLFQETVVGKNFQGDDILKLPNGQG